MLRGLPIPPQEFVSFVFRKAHRGINAERFSTGNHGVPRGAVDRLHAPSCRGRNGTIIGLRGEARSSRVVFLIAHVAYTRLLSAFRDNTIAILRPKSVSLTGPRFFNSRVLLLGAT